MNVAESKPKVIFVYNADSGVVSSVKDYFHKIMRPSTYACKLCAITFGNLGMKKEWKNYVYKDFNLLVEFLHRDEFEARYGMKDVALPAAFLKDNSSLTPIITAEEINDCETMDDLINLVKQNTKNLK